ncbi:MAG: hypothetical protein JJU13_16970 [Balneolaceae bacterium]|nr:hypothetical protein [Balneolaceae bacterium]
MNDTLVNRIFNKLSLVLLLFSTAYISIILIISWLVDIQQVYIYGITEWTEQFPAPIFWLHIFREASLTEYFQWLFLGISVMVSACCWWMHDRNSSAVSWGWALLTIGVLIMVLEDSINLRHKLSYFLSEHFYNGVVGTYEWNKSSFRSIIEVFFYAILGGVMTAALYLLWFSDVLPSKGKYYLISGYIIYGIAAAASATRNIGDWYAKTGGHILDTIIGERNLDWSGESVVFFRDPLGFWFMDHVVEESLELLGATLLLGALVILISFQRPLHESAH